MAKVKKPKTVKNLLFSVEATVTYYLELQNETPKDVDSKEYLKMMGYAEECTIEYDIEGTDINCEECPEISFLSSDDTGTYDQAKLVYSVYFEVTASNRTLAKKLAGDILENICLTYPFALGEFINQDYDISSVEDITE